MKFKKLQRRLGCSKVIAVGTLELLWISTQKNAPRGDIGRFSDEEIAIECDWGQEPSKLISALVDCGWLDVDEEFRLVVHNWAKHAPRYVHGLVAKLGGFCRPPTTVDDYSGGLLSGTTVSDCSEGQPNLTKPNLTNTGGAGVFSKRSAGRKKPTDGLTPEDLRDNDSLSKWFHWQAQQSLPVIADNERNLLLVFSAAERALEKAKNPVAMFVTILVQQLWNNITQAQEDRALARIKKLKRMEAA